MPIDDYYKALGTNIPGHVQNRVAALLNEHPKFIAGAVTNDQDGGRSGTVVAFSDELVVRAVLDGSRHPNQFADWKPDSTVTAAVWRRSELLSVSIEPSPGNADDSWLSDGQWPNAGELTLIYPGDVRVTVVVKASDPASNAALGQFLDQVHQDLRAT